MQISKLNKRQLHYTCFVRNTIHQVLFIKKTNKIEVQKSNRIQEQKITESFMKVVLPSFPVQYCCQPTLQMAPPYSTHSRPTSRLCYGFDNTIYIKSDQPSSIMPLFKQKTQILCVLSQRVGTSVHGLVQCISGNTNCTNGQHGRHCKSAPSSVQVQASVNISGIYGSHS